MSTKEHEDEALPELTAELGERAAGHLLSASPAAAPSRDLRARLLSTVRVSHRFPDLEARCAELLDLDRASAARLLLSIDDAGSWTEGPRPAVELFHVDGGPAVAGAVTGFVRIACGESFPEHEHLGDESVLVLQGALEDEDGTVYRPGDLAKKPRGSRHHLRATGPVRLVYLAVVREGVVIDGEALRPGDPRA